MIQLTMAGSYSKPSPHTPSGRAAEKVVPSMQKFFDKWTLPVLFVLIGGVIGWALWKRLTNRIADSAESFEPY